MKYQLGNYVTERSKPGQILTVSEIDLKNLCVIDGYVLNEETAKQARILPIEKVSPIPLDAEWYKRCNFYRVDHVHGYSFYTFNRKDKANRGLVDLDINENSTTTGGRTINHIKYLHQLQNVFYALNGIELPITHTELTTKKEI